MNKISRGIDPFGVIKEALLCWGRNLIPLTAFNSAAVAFQLGLSNALKLALRTFGAAKPYAGRSEPSVQGFILTGLFVLSIFFIGAFFALLGISYIRAIKTDKMNLAKALKDALARIVAFLKSGLLLAAFIAVGATVSALLLIFGKILYVVLLKSSGQAVAMAGLLVTSTTFVVLVIGVAWYAFFFSLGPLAAAYGHLPAVASLRASRDSIRGNAGRFLLVISSYLISYLAIGLGLYFGITRFVTHDRTVLNMIDPFMTAFLGPFGLSLWYIAYKTLTELRQARKA